MYFGLKVFCPSSLLSARASAYIYPPPGLQLICCLASLCSRKGSFKRSARGDDESDDEDEGAHASGEEPDAPAVVQPKKPKFYFVATFTYKFANGGSDRVYFAYCQPYPASRLNRVLTVSPASAANRQRPLICSLACFRLRFFCHARQHLFLLCTCCLSSCV